MRAHVQPSSTLRHPQQFLCVFTSLSFESKLQLHQSPLPHQKNNPLLSLPLSPRQWQKPLRQRRRRLVLKLIITEEPPPAHLRKFLPTAATVTGFNFIPLHCWHSHPSLLSLLHQHSPNPFFPLLLTACHPSLPVVPPLAVSRPQGHTFCSGSVSRDDVVADESKLNYGAAKKIYT